MRSGRVFEMDHVKGYRKLSVEQRNLFENVYLKHLSSMGEEQRKNYERSQLKEIQWDVNEKCLKVYWLGDTDWFHYTISGEWY